MQEKTTKLKKKGISRRYKEWLVSICFSVALLMILLIVGFGFFALNVSRDNIRNFYSDVASDIVERHINYMNDFLDPYFADLEWLSQSDELKGGNVDIAEDYMVNHIPEFRSSVSDLWYVIPNGIATSVMGREIDVSDAGFFKRIMSGKDSYVVDVYDTKSGLTEEYVIAKSVKNAEKDTVGIVFYSVMFGSISSPVSGMTMGKSFSGFVVNTDGEFIIPIGNDSILEMPNDILDQSDIYEKETFMNDLKTGDKGIYLFHSKIYPDEIVVWAKIKHTDWVMAVDAPLFEIDSSSSLFRKQIIILCSVLILCTLVASTFVFVLLLKKNSSHRLTLQQGNDIDDLTGLWTEALFEEEAEKVFKNNPSQNYLIMGLDIRGFRIVQQTEGVAAANEQLVMLAKRLKEIARLKKGFAARGHIDHFYVMYPIADRETAIREFDAMLYNGNFLAGRAGELIPTKTGIVFAGKDYEQDSIHNLIGKTSYAKHMVQDNLLKNYSVYDSSMEERIISDKRIERYIPIAFSHDEFYVVYQPKINLNDGKVIGAEALVRWNSVELGKVMPDAFIPLFERNGYINRLDFYVYKRVFEFMNARLSSGNPLVPISVNMSRFHLSDEKFVTKFVNLFNNYNIPPELIEIEILERSLGIGDERARLVATQLHDKKFRVAIDDFGTGESSLSLISKIPADILKLDRKFILEVEDASNSSEDEFMIVKQIVDMAKSLGKETICEGVETEKQINFLRSINCNYVQGYFYSKPLNEEDFIRYLESHI